MISMILACGLNDEIGNTSRPDGLPWERNPEDMKFFKETTKGNVVVMGGNTFRQLRDIGFESGLPNRINWVLTSEVPKLDKLGYRNIGTYFNKVNTPYLKANLEILKTFKQEIFIIGGKSIYQQLHPYCDRVYLTRINKTFPDADIKISLDFLSEFDIVNTKKLNEYSHVDVWERKK
ncbi:dihydrofolate reductase [Vibrio phage 1.187.O._10N.286.49.F1]|nr:dihydrofolate reductase [Vibrio phage 1.187.O._10N.286.49.F1]